MKPLTNYEVDEYIRDLPGFKPTKARDQYNGNIKSHELGVINMDVSTGPGSHFICYYNSPKNNQIYYFDSYAVKPPEEIKRYLLTSGKPIAYNTNDVQQLSTSTCGYFCIYVLRELSNGRKYHDVLMDFSYDPNANEEMIIKHFNL